MTFKRSLKNGLNQLSRKKWSYEEGSKTSLMLDSDIIYGLKQLDGNNDFSEVIKLYT